MSNTPTRRAEKNHETTRRPLRSFRLGVFALAALPLLFFAKGSAAQNDVNPKQPNVMLLVDTSGSMELTSTGQGCPNNQPCYPTCVPQTPNTGGPGDLNTKSRWTNLLEVLTGSIANYSCFSEPRIGQAFLQEYQLPTNVNPADYGYEDPFHRALSNECAPGPGALPPQTSPYQFPSNAITFRPYDVGSNSVLLNPGQPCVFTQSGDGLLDSYLGQVRFGLMTFDTHTDAGTGLDTSGIANYQTGVNGTWSYFLNSAAGTGSCNNKGGNGECVGGPYNCTAPADQEVGARNAAAPPWEGRMVAFGPPSEDGTTRDQWIQQILLTTRPYGATPIAGMLNDSRDFFWNDVSKDPLNPTEDFGPWQDPSRNPSPTKGSPGACRNQFQILLTDGEPNLDLRPSCIDPTTHSEKTCPFQTPEEIAFNMANPTEPKQTVRTFVIGFAIGQVTAANGVPSQFVPDGGTGAIDCHTMDLTLCNPLPTDTTFRACCILNEIAFNGTPTALQADPTQITHAFFPQSASDLRDALAQILGSTQVGTGRTFPVTAGSGIGDSTGVGAEIDSGTKVPTGGNGLWPAILTRGRIVCDSQLVPSVQTIDPTKGDDFIANVNADPTNRTLFTVVGDPDPLVPNVRYPTRSMRPFLPPTVTDGIGKYSGTVTAFAKPVDLPGDVPPEAMSVNDTTCDNAFQNLTATQCRDQIMQWAVGLPSATPVSRCSSPGDSSCSVIADIFHSEPQVVAGAPSEFLRDQTYAAFATQYASRDTALYFATNDGFFHSFLLSPGNASAHPDRVVDHRFNNELWAFIPPAVLPTYATMHPGTQGGKGVRSPVLDGTAIIKDVRATTSSTLNANYPYALERVRSPSSSQSTVWRTATISSFGPLLGGYYALDITQPTIATSDTTSGPRFLWQLTSDSLGNPLFGTSSNNPMITTLYVDVGNSDFREVDVAVLPGGDGPGPDALGSCTAGPLETPLPTHGGTTPVFRTSVPCYSQALAARSLTIVRLDTGQILRTFRPNINPLPVGQPAFDPSVLTAIDIPAPIVGQPVAYPSQTGQIADRIFVGDREGRIWRVDVSDTDTSKWTMDVFFDLYAAASNSQPIQTPPVLSVDQSGQLTIAVSTGDQNQLTYDTNPNDRNYLASITETIQPKSGGGTQFQPQANWFYPIANGARVTGSMVLFERGLYYTVYTPAQPGADCDDDGNSKIYVRDYLNGGAIGAAASTTSPAPAVDFMVSDSSVIFGVGLRQLPSCQTTTSAVVNTDSFLGYGKTSVVTAVNSGTFQLVAQRGGVTANSGTSPTAGSGTNVSTSTSSTGVSTLTINLPPPKTTARVSSWAPLIE